MQIKSAHLALDPNHAHPHPHAPPTRSFTQTSHTTLPNLIPFTWSSCTASFSPPSSTNPKKFGHQNFVGALLVSVALSSAIVKSHSTSVVTEDEEDREDDVKGGYHPIHIGDSFSDRRYTIVWKLC